MREEVFRRSFHFLDRGRSPCCRHLIPVGVEDRHRRFGDWRRGQLHRVRSRHQHLPKRVAGFWGKSFRASAPRMMTPPSTANRMPVAMIPHPHLKRNFLQPPAMRRMPNRATISIDPRGLKRQPAKIPKTPWLLQPRQVKLLPASAPLPHPLHVRRPPPSAPPPHQLQAVAHLARLFLARLHSVRATRIPSRNCAHHAAIPSAQLLS